MKTKLYVLRILFILYVFQKECDAITCYQCNSRKDENCSNNKVHLKYLKLCPSGYFYCRKAIYIYYFIDSRNSIIFRECAKSRNSQKECYQGRYSRDTYQFICECVGYGCNPSKQCSPNLLICFLCTLFVIANYFISWHDDFKLLTRETSKRFNLIKTS